MPRMTGLEFLRIIKIDLALYDIPVVVLSTSDMQTDVKAGFRGGVAGYIVKPVTFDKFVQAMAALDIYWTLSELL